MQKMFLSSMREDSWLDPFASPLEPGEYRAEPLIAPLRIPWRSARIYYLAEGGNWASMEDLRQRTLYQTANGEPPRGRY